LPPIHCPYGHVQKVEGENRRARREKEKHKKKKNNNKSKMMEKGKGKSKRKKAKKKRNQITGNGGMWNQDSRINDHGTLLYGGASRFAGQPYPVYCKNCQDQGLPRTSLAVARVERL
jgi:hypothetical protein